MLLPASSLHDTCTASFDYLVLLRIPRFAADESVDADELPGAANAFDRVRTLPDATLPRGRTRAALDRASRSHAVE
jgi:hypothetical protein